MDCGVVGRLVGRVENEFDLLLILLSTASMSYSLVLLSDLETNTERQIYTTNWITATPLHQAQPADRFSGIWSLSRPLILKYLEHFTENYSANTVLGLAIRCK